MPERWVTTTMILTELESSDDGEAWNQLVHHFSPAIVNFAKRFGLSDSDAEDASQQTLLAFMKAYRAGKYRKEYRLSSWLLGIAKNVILNLKSHMPKEKLIADDGVRTSFWNLIQDENAVRHTWNTEWRRMAFEHCLEQAHRELGQKVFRTFELYALEDKPAVEVAEQLSITVNAVYIAKCRVLSKLSELLSEFEECS